MNRWNSDADGIVRTGKEVRVRCLYAVVCYFARERPEEKGRFSMKKQNKNQTCEGLPIEERKATELQPKKRGRFNLKRRLSAKRIAFMAVFAALAYVVSFLEIPLPLFGASFLKLDFGNVFIVLISFLLGPVEGVAVCLLKEGLRCIGSTSNGAGELANFLVTSSYLLLPAITYQYRKNLKTVIITLLCGCVLATGMGLLVNRVLVFPTYAFLMGGHIFGLTVKEAFSAFWVGILLFNLIKTTAVGLLTVLLYKRLSNLMKKMKI